MNNNINANTKIINKYLRRHHGTYHGKNYYKCTAGNTILKQQKK